MGIIRIILALSVLLTHTQKPIFGTLLLPAFLAIQAFFVISGFYMSLILNEKYKKSSYFLFISNRLLRIYPIYWIILIATIILYYFFHFSGINAYVPVHFFTNSPGPVILYSDIPALIRDFTILIRFDYFSTIFNPGNFNVLTVSQAWTLVIELIFYFIAPFIVKRSTKILLLMTIVALVFRYSFFVFLKINHVQTSDIFFPAELYYFLLGSLSYKLYVFLKSKSISSKLVFFMFLFLIFFSWFYGRIPNLFYKFITVNEVIFIFVFSLFIPFIFLKTKRIKLDRFLGSLSYPVYLSHLLVITFLTNLGIFSFWKFDFNFIVILITSVISVCLILFIEKPINKIRQERVILAS